MADDLKIIRELKKTERFESYEVEYKGKRAFAKHAASDNTAVHLIFQKKNSETVNNIGAELVRSPKILVKRDDWIVTEWVGGQPIESLIDTEPEKVARITAEVVNIFDSQPDSTTPLREIFTHAGLAKRVEERIHPNITTASAQLFDETIQKFRSYESKLQACLQDADVQPEHLFIDETGQAKYVLIDSEHLNTHWPRFYDLANNYSKYWKRDNRGFARLILKEYLEITNRSPEEIFEPLAACLIVRALALHWENDYDPGALDTNIPRSQELLKLILESEAIVDLL
ncbi:MAG TPA: hypothetical protein VG964_00920 [Candidatus Saccharimonadales bacterium]|nr:hypothetical protein [Candidatus Saccharimonadales bacterium]